MPPLSSHRDATQPGGSSLHRDSGVCCAFQAGKHAVSPAEWLPDRRSFFSESRYWRTWVNRFPDFVRYIVQRLKTLCHSLSKRKIAQMLVRAGLHLGSTTVQRMLKERPVKPPGEPAELPIATGRVVTADYPDHVHHVDLTLVPTAPGLWAF